MRRWRLCGLPAAAALLLVMPHASASTGLAGPLRGLTVQGEGGSTAAFRISSARDLLTTDRACAAPVPGGPGAWGGVLVHKDGAPANQVTGFVVVNGVAGKDCAYVIGLGPSPFRLTPGRYTAALLGKGAQSHTLGTDAGREIGTIRTNPRHLVAQRPFFVSERVMATWSQPLNVGNRTIVVTADGVRGQTAHASVGQSCLTRPGTPCADAPSASARPAGDRGHVDPVVHVHAPGSLSAGDYVYQGRLVGPPDAVAAGFSLLVDVPQ